MTIQVQIHLPLADFALDCAFELHPERICVLFGPSGSGKTSVLRCLSGLEPDCQGRVQVGNEIWQDRQSCLPPHRRAIGYVFQEACLLPHLSVLGNLAYGWQRTPPGQRRTTPDEMAALLDISHLLTRRSAQLSGGERQKVAIARALLSAPQLLLMDEAISSLDRASKQAILPWLKQVQQQFRIPILYVTHALDEVMQLADDLILLERGQIKARGALPEMLTRLDLPLAHLEEAESLIQARVKSHETEFHLLHLESDFGPVHMVHAPLPTGSLVKLRIRAKDVSLMHAPGPACAPGQESSILNILPVEIAQMDADRPGSVLLVLRNPLRPEGRLLARISAKSAHTMNLAAGQQVAAQFKAVALT